MVHMSKSVALRMLDFGIGDEVAEKKIDMAIKKYFEQGYFDAFREFHKEGGNYTWWSYYKDCRARNIGWRLDYFLVDISLKQYCTDSIINSKIYGSDHCPISCSFNFI